MTSGENEFHDGMTLTERIKTKARELGFHKIGIARVTPLFAEGERLREWLQRGDHGSMQWMERSVEKRIDPRLIVPDAVSVISLAVNYYTPHEHPVDEQTGKISRYAWGDDYHHHVTRRIQMLFECISQWEPGSTGRFYVDTGPVMEKAWAVRAGIGWLGKHTNVITKEYGSWVFLGEIITSLRLDADEPMEDFCGTCTACIDACPTDAIHEPYAVNSNTCISYLTIEHRGEIARSLGKNFDHWIYGCDICQDVCPWNRFQKETDHPEYQPREWNKHPDLEELRQITPEEFARRFKDSPIKRTKREGIIRNVIVVQESGK